MTWEETALGGGLPPDSPNLDPISDKKKGHCAKILGVLADNLYYDGALVHEPDYF